MPKITEKPLDLSNFKPKTVSPSVLAALNPKPEPVPEPIPEPVVGVESVPLPPIEEPPVIAPANEKLAQAQAEAEAQAEAHRKLEEEVSSLPPGISRGPITDGIPTVVKPSLPLELKIALYETASQIYLKQRPEINQGSSPKPPKDWTVTKDVEEYSKAVESHMRAALSYSVVESKSIWANLFGEVLP